MTMPAYVGRDEPADLRRLRRVGWLLIGLLLGAAALLALALTVMGAWPRATPSPVFPTLTLALLAGALCTTWRFRQLFARRVADQDAQVATMSEAHVTAAVMPYGSAATLALDRIHAALDATLRDDIPRLIAMLPTMEVSRSLLARMTPEEQPRLGAVLHDHLRMLIDPGLPEETHRTHSVHLGVVHGLTGVVAADSIRLLDTVAGALHKTVDDTSLTAVERMRAHAVLQVRFANELQFEQEGRWQLDIERHQALATIQKGVEGWSTAGTFPAEVVQLLSGLHGMRGVAWGRPDDDNLHVVEFSAGRALDLLGDPETRRATLRVGTRETRLQPFTLRAWASGQIEITDNIALDPRMAAWAPMAARLGIRSGVAVPLLDETGLPVAVLSLYGAFPGQFSNQLAGIWLWALQELVQRRGTAPMASTPPISVEQRRSLRQALYEDGLQMVLQPLVDLKTGEVDAVEALARLSLDGQMLPPSAFLPAFGTVELQDLFRRGLDQSLAFLARERGRLPRLRLGINLPPAVLEQPGCEGWIMEALRRFGVPPNRLLLELLELDGSRNWKERASVTLRSLAAEGVHLVMDDLGSGHSGLQRLRSLPFDKVKIDQNLIRQALHDPENTIPFIGGLIEVAHRLGMRVVAEGLESVDLVEMVAFLGADYGQGYALARPMPPEALADWADDFVYAVDPARPLTDLGMRAVRELEKTHGLATLQ
ncbi:EAL domain-containing protein [Acidisoma sp. 7E03]